ncbi:recombinase family protein [Streptomyces sp. NPDC006733]|uniref:recombinase family protein n=1 Tax=Streptomyces sp. NPDC006733 TaxID=3155460 RepID=UPI0033FBD276
MCADIAHGHEEETGIPVRGCVAVERDRVYRRPRDFVAFQDALLMVGDGVFIEDTTLLDLVHNDGTICSYPVIAPADEAEVTNMRKRAARNAADRAKEGKTCGAPRRFGWLGASKDPYRVGNKHRNEEEWPHLTRMIKMRYAGRSWRSITGEVNRLRVTTARGGVWTEQSVKSIVTNPAWWGGRVYNGEVQIEAETGEPVIGEWDHVRDSDECTYEMWQQIMAGVRANRLHRGMTTGADVRSLPKEPRTRGYLFSGFLRCGRINDFDEVCYAKLNGNRSTGKNAKYGNYYRCGDPNCKGIGRRVAAVDAYLEGLALAYLDRRFAGTEVTVTPWRGKAKLARLRKQSDDMRESLASGDAPWGDAYDILTRLARNITTLEQEEADHLQAEARRNLIRGWIREKWESSELAERREILGHVFTAIVVLPVPAGVSDKAAFDPDLLTVQWRNP